MKKNIDVEWRQKFPAAVLILFGSLFLFNAKTDLWKIIGLILGWLGFLYAGFMIYKDEVFMNKGVLSAKGAKAKKLGIIIILVTTLLFVLFLMAMF